VKTVYDWVSIAIFAGLVVLFLQRSSGRDSSDALWPYIVAAVGCALANYLGNNGYAIPAVGVLGAALAFTYYVIRPFGTPRD